MWKHFGRVPVRVPKLSARQAFETASRAESLLIGPQAADLRRWFLARDESVRLIVARADEAMAHRTSLLGSERAHLGATIDWHRDWVAGTVWPREHFSELDLLKLDERCDVKRCWDLSRAYHWVWLAQAFWLTNQPGYLEEIKKQWSDWLDQNPVEIAVNWSNAMEAAIRSVSWWWVLALTAGKLDAQLLTRVCGSLSVHLDYISSHLEFAGDGRNSNHLLADYVGLAFGGILFASHPSAPRWLETGLSGLWRELPLQVYTDGVNCEQSTEYHRFVLEFFLHTAILARRAGHEPAEAAWKRLAGMLEFCMHMTRPDGLANAIGDGDDGRLVWLTEREPLDFRGLLGVGAVLFQRTDFKWVADPASVEDVAWVLGCSGVREYEDMASAPSRTTTVAFPEGGVYVVRTGWSRDETHVAIDAGHLGMGAKGRGSHGHADTLSFCVSIRGQPTLVDPGTYTYTGDASWRDAFRGGRMHNAVTVDGQGVCSFDDGLFRWSSLCSPVVERWESDACWVRFAGSHDGFERLEINARHRRAIWVCLRPAAVVVHDRLTGSGEHTLDVWYQFRAGSEVEPLEAARGTWVGSHRTAECGVLVSRQAAATRMYRADEQEKLGWVSPSYGRRLAGTTLQVSAGLARLPIDIVTIVAPFETDPKDLLSLATDGSDPELAGLLEQWF